MTIKRIKALPVTVWWLAAVLVFGVSVSGAAYAQTRAQTEGSGQSADTVKPVKPTKQTKTKTKKKKTSGTAAAGRAGRTQFLPGSQESPAERAARLTRECKGAVNAGACEGYTR